MYWVIDSFVLGVRAASILAVFQAAGGYVFLRLFERELGVSAAAIRELVRWSALAAVLLTMLYYFLVPVRMAGSFAGLFDATLGDIVAASSVQSAQAAVFIGSALLAVSLDAQNAFNRAVCLLGAALAVLSFALTGHTTIHDLRPVLAPALVVHVTVAAVWLGALWPLRIVAGKEDPERRTRIVARFSSYAVRAVPVLFVCGATMTVLLLGSIDQVATPYGAMLALKTAGFAGVLVIANFNRTRLAPAMARGDAARVQTFRQVLVVEALSLGAVVVVTVLMTGFFAPDTLHGSFTDDHQTETHD